MADQLETLVADQMLNIAASATEEIVDAKPLEPIREVLESEESDVIHCWALVSRRSAACGSPTIAAVQAATGFVTQVI